MQTGAANEHEMEWAIRWRDAPHGQKGAVMQAACKALNASSGKLHRRFPKLVAVYKPPRKRRSDAGRLSLTRDEALVISGLLKETMRMAGKKNMTAIHVAMAQLRANGEIAATRTDPATGEVIALSDQTILRSLHHYHCHPLQQRQPEPVMRLRSKHPNYLWQIDASRCVLYYLPTAQQRARGESGLTFKPLTQKAAQGLQETGLQEMPPQAFNKNKPANLMKAMRSAIWRYVITDHASGWVYVHYVLGGESSANVIDAFLGAMAQREHQPMHGVPKMVMLDPGGANVSAAFISVCQALGVRYLINAVGNPRAKGQVEKAQDIVERQFESRLKTMPREEVSTLEQINELAQRWVRMLNATATHSRHGMTRDMAWMRIKPEELVAMPDAALLRQLAAAKPEERKVQSDLTVQFMGVDWDVSGVPGINVGEKLSVCRNAFDANTVHAMGHSEDGVQVFYALPRVEVDAYGQRVDAPVVGESYRRHADTPVQKTAKEIERLVMGAETDAEAAQKRKAKAPFMGGRFDPFADVKAVEGKLPLPLPRRGQAHGLEALQPPVRDESLLAPMLTHIQAARRLKDLFKTQLGEDWLPAHYEQMRALYPQGVPEDRVEALARELCAAIRRTSIHLVPHVSERPRLHLVA